MLPSGSRYIVSVTRPDTPGWLLLHLSKQPRNPERLALIASATAATRSELPVATNGLLSAGLSPGLSLGLSATATVLSFGLSLVLSAAGVALATLPPRSL